MFQSFSLALCCSQSLSLSLSLSLYLSEFLPLVVSPFFCVSISDLFGNEVQILVQSQLLLPQPSPNGVRAHSRHASPCQTNYD